MNLSSYKEVDYKVLQRELQDKKKKADIPDVNLAVELEIKSTGTIRNAFNMDEQVASDEILTKIFKILAFPAFIGWFDGERKYFISSKK